MKKTFLLLAGALLAMAACKQPETKTEATTATPDYPYKIKNPDYWLMDTGHTNTMTALKLIKAFETVDTAGLKAPFGDSIEFNYDGGKFKGLSTEFAKTGADMARSMKNLKIDMKDWEAVVSKDGKEEWVTLWYVQKWTDEKGGVDSVSLVNDLQFKAGKIVKFNEYAMHAKLPVH